MWRTAPYRPRYNRASFRKAFDLYGLGCLLIEVGLWSNLTTILLHFSRAKKDPIVTARIPAASLHYASEEEKIQINKSKVEMLADAGHRSIMEALKFAAGETFASAVKSCLSAGDEREAGNSDDSSDEEDEDADDGYIDLELDILRKLKKCRA